MEKHVPQYPLHEVHTLLRKGAVRSTRTALEGGAALDFDFRGIVSTVQNLTQGHFYKSMTSHHDHHIWHDVYCALTEAGEVYIKLTVDTEGLLVISFKER